MKERPILFSAPMIRALLAGNKTQTRRVINFERIAKQTGCKSGKLQWFTGLDSWGIEGNEAHVHLVDCPYGAKGDRLWVRETTLEILSVRVERLQDITPGDCIAEGIDLEQHKCGCEKCAQTIQLCPATSSSLVMEYTQLWDSINGKGSWGLNPFVWVLEFKMI